MNIKTFGIALSAQSALFGLLAEHAEEMDKPSTLLFVGLATIGSSFAWSAKN